MNTEYKPFSYLKSLNKEGLVIFGAGGNPDEWVNGITGLLSDESIIDGRLPEVWLSKAFILNDNILGNNGRTDLVMVFNVDAKIDMGRLAIWRIQHKDCSWISDFIINFKKDYQQD